MRFEDHLSKEQKQQLNNVAKKKERKKKQEKLSQKDWEEIMGLHRDTYARKNGAWRRK